MPTAGSLDLPSFGATVGHRAGAGGSAQWRGEQRHHARAARKAGAALRAVSTGVDSAPRGIDRPRPPVPHRPAASSCERRCAGEQAAPAPAAACGAVGRGRSGAAGAGAGGPRASPGAAGGVGPVCARSLAVGRTPGRRLSVCGWGAQQPGGGAPLCLRQSESGASAGARRRTHSREARRARRAPDLEPVQGRCGLGSSSARGVHLRRHAVANRVERRKMGCGLKCKNF